MFDGLFSTPEQKSPVDILESLLTDENIEMKSDINMKQIKVLVLTKYYAEIKKPENREKTALEIVSDIIIPYYLKLVCSIDRNRIKDLIKGYNEKQQFIEQMLLRNQQTQ